MNVIGVWNTPGFFYAIGYSLATGVVLCHERSEGGARRKWASGVAAWLFMSGVLYRCAGRSITRWHFNTQACARPRR